MNPTSRAHIAFVLAVGAFVVSVLVGASAFAPASLRPSLDALAPRLATALNQPAPILAPAATVQSQPSTNTAIVPVQETDPRSADDTPAAVTPTTPEAVSKHVTLAQPSSAPQATAQVKEETEVANTEAHVAVEITISKLPEPPGVAASYTTTTVEVAPPTKADDPWAPVRDCESGDNYATNTGNGFYGAYQFTVSSWDWVAGRIGREDLVGVRPDHGAPADQDALAQALAFEVDGGGLRHWPVCGRRYGS